MRQSGLIGCVCALATGAVAGDWARLEGAEIAAALTDQSYKYEDARQTFFASGKTRYTFGEDSWGNWRVVDDRYCSQWPPGQDWDCYAIDAIDGGARVRFVDDFGNATEGVRLE